MTLSLSRAAAFTFGCYNAQLLLSGICEPKLQHLIPELQRSDSAPALPNFRAAALNSRVAALALCPS
ncbi:hypothetical protein TIFTF001_004508 [Ficus carica]|uniref:Uncharacterized protein n=1 Tax=Ficus carica TaxID=3494 RepID=A0AA88A4Q9_FICCA|nr:hypothetical protein TIFTF001_004508 [Ficus carica]